MKKLWTKAAAVLLALALALGMTGCSGALWVMKTDKMTVPTGVYLYYLIVAYNDAQTKLSSSSSSSSSTSSSSSINWSKKIEGKSAKEWATDEAVTNTRELLATEALCAQKKITLSSTEKSSVTTYAENLMSSYSILKENGISQASVERVLAYNEYLKDKLFDSYYAKGGTEAVSDADLKAYYTKNFVQIKQIFFSITDDNGSALSTADQKKKKEKADSVLGQIKSDRSNFEALVKADNEDPGMTSDPSGYIFGKTGQYLDVFKNAAFSMKVGDVKLITSSEGYHIMYKVQLDQSKFTSVKSDVLSDMKNAEFLKKLDSYPGITINKYATWRYKVTGLKQESDTSSS